MPRGAAAATTGDTADAAPRTGQAKRAEILAAATELIAAQGIKGMTMRQLAAAAGLNIATLYHYFGSKSELIGAIVDERNYDAGLRHLALPVDPDLAPRPRLEAVFGQLVVQALGELRLWRLLVGESLRDDPVALAEARRLSGSLEQAVARWLADLFPELGSARGAPGLDATTTVVTGQLLAAFLHEMLLGEDDRTERIARRASATAAVVFPDG